MGGGGLLLVLVSVGLSAEPVTRPLGVGEIDWSTLELTVTISSNQTRGAWQDRRLQEQDALDQLSAHMEELAVDVPIRPDQTVGDLIDAGGELGERLASGISRWSVEEARYYTRGGVELVGVLDLRTWLWPVLVSYAQPEMLPPAEGVTGVLIDAREVDLPLSLCPSVRTATGGLLVGVGGYSEEFARRRPQVIFVTDAADPAAVARVGEFPLMVQATGVDSDGSLVLSPEHEMQLLQEEQLATLANRGNIVVVVTP